MKHFIEKCVPQDMRNRRNYIEQTLKILANAKGDDNLKQTAVALYAPMGVSFSNVAFMGNRVDLMANGWVESLSRLGYRIIVGLVQEEDIIDINVVGFTKEAPVKHSAKSLEAPTLENVKQGYCFAYNENNGLFTAVERVTLDELKAIQKKSKGNVWKDFPGEMMKKAIIRRFIKRLGVQNEHLDRIVETHDSQYNMNKMSEEDALLLLDTKINATITVPELVSIWNPVKKQDIDFQNKVIPLIITRLKEFDQSDITVEKSIIHFENMIKKA